MNDDFFDSARAGIQPDPRFSPPLDADQTSSYGSQQDDTPAHRLRQQQASRQNFLSNLRRNIDIVIYCQLSILYYMDCSLFHFHVRALPHWVFFTPKPPFFPQPPRNRPYVSIIVLTNCFCMLMHLFGAQLEAGEATRGYLHGGLLINFVGELGPISRWRMLFVDISIIVLQIVILGIVLETQALKSAIDSSSTTTSGDEGRASAGLATEITRQDIDAEEQGIRRSQENFEDDIELETLHKERGTPSEALHTLRRRKDHALDVFYSGQVVVLNVNFSETIRAAWGKRYDV